MRRAAPGDEAHILELIRTSYADGRVSGPRDPSEAELTELLTEPNQFSYLAEDGFVTYSWHGSDLSVDLLLARSEQTARALWATVGSGSSVAKTVHAYVSPSDPLHLLIEDQVAKDAKQIRWMLRVLDAAAAVAGRGFPMGLSLDVPVRVDDPLLPGCSGSWVLRVVDGRGSLEPAQGGGEALRLGPNGLAALHAGTPLATLRTGGLATGGSPADDALLDSAFAATPHLLDYF